MEYDNLLKYTNEKNEFMKYNGIKIKCIKEDYAEVELEIKNNSLNPYGLVHGGAYYTMADCASGIASRTNNGRYVTLNSNFSFIKSVKDGKLKAVAKIVNRGRTICIVRAEVLNDKNDLVAEGTFTMFCLNQPEENNQENK